MEQRDLIPDQIEQAGKVLAKLLSDLIGYKSKGMFTIGIEQTRQGLMSELKIDLNQIISSKGFDITNHEVFQNLKAEHFEILSEYIHEIGEYFIFTNKIKAIACFERSIELLMLADEGSKTLSFARFDKRKLLQNKLCRLK
jgi:hypothetical protein